MNRRQRILKELRYTIKDFYREFPNDDVCLEHIKEQRWPNGVTQCFSEHCKGLPRKHHRVSGRTAYACDHCGHHEFPLAGTIFEKTSTSLRLWFYAMYLMGSTRCGISAKQIQRETGVTYKTAWRMFKQIRTLMSEEISLEGSTVEMDETYMGGRSRHGSKRGRAGAGSHKQCVVAKTSENASAEKLIGMAKEFIMPESTVFTDEWTGYSGLGEEAKVFHKRINHAEKVYVMGDVHTQTIDGFWSLVKRGIGGVYHQISKKYMQSYLGEYSFRYNRRDQGNLIFTSILKRVSERASEQPGGQVAENLPV
ncbi:MAG TPA: IS1595 family transposase [Candidatus Angelobacter sp.]|jgi:transposase-like protein|nr:IS1595 family transposase [Candidatus Angelobacter sp.]